MVKAHPLHFESITLHPLFDANPALWEGLTGSIHKKHFQDKDRIVLHGDVAGSLWLVYKGWVKLSRQTPEGKDTIVGLCTEGDVFGEAALFPNANYPYTAEAIGADVELVAIPATMIRGLIAKDDTLSAHVMAMLNDRMSQTQLKLEHMSTLSAAQRLGCFLLKLCQTQTDDSKILTIPVEKNVLAAFLGMKPETLSRSQQQLKTVGISVSGHHVTISNVANLRKFVCGGCSESGACDTEDASTEMVKR